MIVCKEGTLRVPSLDPPLRNLISCSGAPYPLAHEVLHILMRENVQDSISACESLSRSCDTTNFLDRVREDRRKERPGRAVAGHRCASLRDPSEQERCGKDTGKDHDPCKDQDPGVSPGFFLGRRHWITLPFLESNSDLNDPRVYTLTASTARYPVGTILFFVLSPARLPRPEEHANFPIPESPRIGSVTRPGGATMPGSTNKATIQGLLR